MGTFSLAFGKGLSQQGTNLNQFKPKYFVDSINGLDTNDGLTANSAWKTITKVNATSFIPGDKIGFKSGQTFSGALTISTSGLIDNYIEYGTYGGTLKAIIEQSALNTTLNISKSYIRIKNLEIKNNSGDTSHRTIYISGTTILGVDIDNCKIYSSGYGILSGATGLSNCNFTRNYVSGGKVAIYSFGTGSSNIAVLNNTCLNTGGGIQLRYITNPQVSYNNVSGFTSGQGIQIHDCAGTLQVSYNNVHDATVTNAGLYLSNNTFTEGLLYRNIVNNVGGNSAVISNSYNLTVSNSVFCNSLLGGAGLRIDNNSHHITVSGCFAFGNTGDGFINTSVHDITYIYCRASGNGTKTTTTEGDGFTSHLNDYAIKVLYCISDNNTASGVAMVGNSTGFIYGCIFTGNAGDYTSEGGLNQDRGGIYIGTAGLNPTTGTGWVVKNCVCNDNYPQELHISVYATLNNNCYFAKNSSVFATFNGTDKQSWDTYHLTHEANSIYQNPLLNGLIPTNKIEIGEDLGLDYNAGLDISTIWGNGATLPVIVTKQQAATWQVGAYIHN